jgi:hypothetical protein
MQLSTIVKAYLITTWPISYKYKQGYSNQQYSYQKRNAKCSSYYYKGRAYINQPIKDSSEPSLRAISYRRLASS